YGGQTYASQSPYSQSAIEGMGNFSTQPSQDYMSNVMNRQYMGPEMQQGVMNPAMAATNQQFAGAGRYGSAANQQQSYQAGMSALMPYYDAEQNRKMQAAQNLPGLQQQQWANQAAGGLGAEQYAQQPIDEAMARHQFAQNQPLMPAQAYGQMVNPLFGLNNQDSQQTGWGETVGSLMTGGAAVGSMIAPKGFL
ncbi:unnamed protein product, partial [marine sediment metagenome]